MLQPHQLIAIALEGTALTFAQVVVSLERDGGDRWGEGHAETDAMQRRLPP